MCSSDLKAICTSTTGADSGYSKVVSRTCDCAAPVVKIALSNGKPRLTWDKVDGATSYVIYRATTANGTYSKLFTTSGTSMTNTGAVSGKTYYYKVVAVSSRTTAATSAYSNVVHILSK